MACYKITRRVEIDMGHRVPSHQGKCRHLHGHRYVVDLLVVAEELIPDAAMVNDSGMVVDFGGLKSLLQNAVVEPFDHQLVLWDSDPLLQDAGFLRALHKQGLDVRLIGCIPTAEHLAELWGRSCQRLWTTYVPPTAHLHGVRVYETPNSTAEWYAEQ